MKEEKKKFYSLLSDTTFKYLFKNEKVRPMLEKVIKYYTDVDLKGYEFIDNELNSGDELKDYRLDSILVSPDKKHIVNVEMNKESSNYILLKNRTYLHRIAGNLLKENEDYSKIKDYFVEQINFNNFYCSENKDVEVNTYRLSDNKHNLTIENFKIHNIYISKASEVCYNEINKFMKLFTCKSYEEMRKIALDDKEMNLIVDEIERLNKEKYYGALYNIHEEQELLERSARSEGKEEGFIEGAHLAKLEDAKNFKKNGVDIEIIAKSTGLTIEEINKL